MNQEIKVERESRRVYVEGDRCYKVFDVDEDKATILAEAMNQSLVEQTGLLVPAVLEMKMIDGKWAMVTQNIEGKTLEEMLEENPDKEDELLKRFVDIQIDMQSRKVPLLSKHRDKMNRKIALTDLSATMRYNLHDRIEQKPRHNYLCHGDYNPTNVVINAQNEAYIVDWKHATQGNAEADAARTFMMFLIEGKKKRAGRYLTLFCEKSGCDYQEVLSWLPILAATQSVKGKPEEVEFLHSLIFMYKKDLEELYEH